MDSHIPWRKLTVGTLLVLIVTLLSVYFFRLALAESLIAALLESRGIPGGATVIALGHDGIRLERVSLEELTADSIDVRWQWAPTRGLMITRVTVDGLDVSADLTGERRPFAALLGAAGEPSDGGRNQAWPAPPDLTLRNGRGRLITQAGVVNLAFSLETEADSLGDRAYVGKVFASATPNVSANADVRMEWTNGNPRASLLSVTLKSGSDGGQSDGTVALGWHAGRLDTDIAISGRLPDVLLRHLGLLSKDLSGQVDGAVEGTISWTLPEGGLIPTLEPDHATIRFRVDGTGVAWADVATEGRVAWSGEAVYDRGQDLLEVRPSTPLSLGLALPARERSILALADLVLPDAFSTVSGTLDASMLQVRPATGTVSMEDARIELASSRGGRLATRGPMKIRLGPEPALTTRMEVTLALPDTLRDVSNVTGDGAVAITGNGDEFVLALTEPLAVSLTPAKARLPEPLSTLAGTAITIRAAAQAPTDSPYLTIRSRSGDLAASFDCRVALESRISGNLEIRAFGTGQRTDPGTFDLDMPDLSAQGTDLPTPYGTVDRATASGRLAYRNGHLDATFTGGAEAHHLAMDTGSVDQGGIAVAGTLSGTPDDLRIWLGPSSIHADAVTLSRPDRLRLAPVSVAIEHTDFSIRSGVLSGDARLKTGPASVQTGDTAVDLGTAEFMLSATPGGRLSGLFRIERVEVLGPGLGAYDVQIAARQTGTEKFEAELRQVALRDLALPQRLSSLKATGILSAAGRRLEGKLEIRPDKAPQATLSITGGYDTGENRGHAEIHLGGVVFDPGLQPRALWLGASDLDMVAGRLDFLGNADFDASGVASSGGSLNLVLDSFESEGTRVTGLSLPLTLSSLWPVESPPGQHLTIDRIGDGTGASTIDVEYRLAPGQDGIPVLEISHGALDTLGGRIRIPPTRLDPEQAVNSLLLEADDLDLVSVLSLITREGIDGEGRLSGRFPIRFEGEDLVIDGAVLESEAPGRLAFTSPAATQTLKSSGDHMMLLLHALENFHYERLSLTVDKAAGGEARLRLSLRGHNPDVLDGYPLAINIDLQTDVAPFLSVLRQGNDMVDEVVKRIWRP